MMFLKLFYVRVKLGFFTLVKDSRLMVVENRVLREVFGPKMDEFECTREKILAYWSGI